MDANMYHFITRWRVDGTPEEVSDILNDPRELVRWWPAVYLGARRLRAGDSRGVGGEYSLYTKGWLPYTLRWSFRVVEAHPPHGFAIEAWGDFVGRGVWTIERRGDTTEVIYDWRIRADKPLLRWGSPVFKPLFAANHRWAMARGEESLRLELLRRRAATRWDRAAVPAPPPPTTTASYAPLSLAAAATLAACGVGYRLIRRAS